MVAGAVFSVLVTLLVVLLLQGLLKSIASADRATHKTDDLVFAYVQFNRFVNEDKNMAYVLTKESNSRQAALVKIDQKGKKKIYVLTFYKNMIRVTTPEGGHMPLLLGVRTASFESRERQIKITVTEKDKRKSEIYFKLDAKPKEKTKDEPKKNKAESKRTIK
ncbi:hypothetical protein KIM322_05780 [Lactobacillus xylocopicola]|uniref:Competence protein ComGF n=2 Tax=Lactobacillus xylocopicola TaxID=2976676 RepID=A0ABN6SM79_9LACO|nr:hypothetical protein KIM322_05780 [Lactobacillus xylocopicola]